MLTLKNLSIGYFSAKNNIKIQHNINATLERGELTCLLGPNGAGKTTLLRTIAGFLPALEGEISLNDRDIKNFSKKEMSEYLSVVLTEKPKVQAMTVEQIVGLGRSPYTGFWGRINNEDSKVITKALEETGIIELKDRAVDTLSDGELQKVMVAKSLAQSTPIILLDEPTAFLDFPSKAETLRLLTKLAHDQNKSILQSTHDLNMALALADKLWVMDKNHGFMVGTPRELSDNGVLEKYFLREGIIFDSKKISFNILK